MQSCQPDTSRLFGGVVTADIRRFETRVLATHFGATLESWERNSYYHSYYNVSTLCGARDLDRAWGEYLRDPAPTLSGPRDGPIKEGDTSIAATFLDGWRPLPGGWVTHYLDEPNHALANATNRMHVLYPGYIVRWIAVSGHVVVSNTLGRGIGFMPRSNEDYGVQIFQALDEQIRARLNAQ